MPPRNTTMLFKRKKAPGKGKFQYRKAQFWGDQVKLFSEHLATKL